MKVRIPMVSLSAVGLRTALRYRKNWNKNSSTVKQLQLLMPKTEGAKKGFRLYRPIGETTRRHYSIPPAVRAALKREGFIATDYLGKKCVKIGDTQQKNEFNIGKVIAKDIHAKVAFDNDPQLQNSKTNEHVLVVSCHPYDIIGMSTGRDWDKQSCMRLDDGIVNKRDSGAYSHHVTHDVAEGTLVAYAIKASDTNISKPKCRCLLKQFRDEHGNVLYRRESRIYGNNVPGFASALNKVLTELNKHAPEGDYTMVPSLYNDGIETEHRHKHAAEEGRITIRDVIDDSEKFIDFVKQEIEASKDPERSAKELVRLTNYTDDDGFDTNEFQLHDSQIEEAAELLRGNQRIAEEFVSSAMIGELDKRVGIQLGIKSGFFDGLRNNPAAKEIGGSKFLQRIAFVQGDAQDALISEIEEDIKTAHYYNANDFVRRILKRKVEIPSMEMLARYPIFYRFLYTAASAARFTTFDSKLNYAGGAFEFLSHVESPPQKIHGENQVNNLQSIGGLELVLGYFLDNVGNLKEEELYWPRLRDVAYKMDNKRLFNAFNRVTEGFFKQFFDHVKMEIFKYVVDSGRETVLTEYRHTFPTIIKMLESDPELLIGQDWGVHEYDKMVRIDPKLVMGVDRKSVYSGEIVDSMLNRLVSGYTGEILEPKTKSAEFLAQQVIAVGDIIEPAFDARPFFKGVNVLSVGDVAIKYKNVSVSTYTYHKVFSRMISDLVKVNGHKVHLTKYPDLILADAPESFKSIKGFELLDNLDNVIELTTKLKHLDEATRAITHIVTNLYVTDIDDLEEYATEYADNRYTGNGADSAEYNALYQEGLKTIKDQNRPIMETNRRRLDAMQKVRYTVGESMDSLKDWLAAYYPEAKESAYDVEILSNYIDEAIEECTENMTEWEEWFK